MSNFLFGGETRLAFLLRLLLAIVPGWLNNLLVSLGLLGVAVGLTTLAAWFTRTETPSNREPR